MNRLSTEFVCPHCGESHEGFPTDYGYSLPDEVWALPPKERESSAWHTPDLHQMGERFFIRCILRVPLSNPSDYFAWGLWAEVTQAVFEHYVSVYDQDSDAESPAHIANQLPGYPPLLNHPVSIQFGSATERPTLWFPPDSHHQLAVEQRQGLTPVRYHELLEAIGFV